MKYTGFAALAAIASLAAASADDCGPLRSYGTVPLAKIGGYTSLFVPVEIAGTPKLMMLDTGASLTTITSTAVTELGLTTARSTRLRTYDITGDVSDSYTKASLKIGGLKGDDVVFRLGTAYLSDLGDNRIAGLLGEDLLSKFDVSIDFGAPSITLIDQNHCDGQVVYWPERPIAIVPMKFKDGQISVTVTLDGKEVEATLDTGASHTTLEKEKAENAFDIKVGSADTPTIGDHSDANALPMWKHRFTTLNLAGIQIDNPEITIIPDKTTDAVNTWSTGSLLEKKAYGGGEHPPMLLGMTVLKHFHIYIAYKEKKLYITPAGPPAAGK